jgi:hypothetical protein
MWLRVVWNWLSDSLSYIVDSISIKDILFAPKSDHLDKQKVITLYMDYTRLC